AEAGRGRCRAATGRRAVVVARLGERVAGRRADARQRGAVRVEDARIVGTDEVGAAAVGGGLADRLALAVGAGEPPLARVEAGGGPVGAGGAGTALDDRAVGEAGGIAGGRAGRDPGAALVRWAGRLHERVAGNDTRVGAGVGAGRSPGASAALAARGAAGRSGRPGRAGTSAARASVARCARLSCHASGGAARVPGPAAARTSATCSPRARAAG